MKLDLILFLLFTSIILSQTTQEEKEKEIDTTTKNISEELPQNQTAKKPRIKLIDFTYKDTNRKSQTIELTNYNLDSLVKNGEENRWLIIFYAETCSFCKTVKSLIDKIIEEKKYKNINNIKFGSVDVDYNLYLQMRFNVTGIPVLLLVENNKMIELSNMPLEENLMRSIEIENIENDKYVKDFPKEINYIEFSLRLISFYLSRIPLTVNELLSKYNIKHELGSNSVSLILIFTSAGLGAGVYFLFNKCFGEKKPEKKDEKNEEKNIEEKNEDKDINKDMSEEMKKKAEDKKEEERKMNERINEDKMKDSVNSNTNSDKTGEAKKKEKKKKKE